MTNAAAAYLLLVAVGITGAVGDIAVYQWATSRQLHWLITSYCLWIISVTLFGFFFRYERFTFGPALLVALAIHAVVCVACDYIHFGNRLTRLETLGIAFAAVSIILLEVGRSPMATAPGATGGNFGLPAPDEDRSGIRRQLEEEKTP